jgi:hypothetical protein
MWWARQHRSVLRWDDRGRKDTDLAVTAYKFHLVAQMFDRQARRLAWVARPIERLLGEP